MFKKTKDSILHELIDHFTKSPKDLWDILEEYMLKTPAAMKKFEARIDSAKAVRISNEINRRLETLERDELEHEQSTEPWFSYLVLGHDTVQGWKTKLSWNAAFIKQAKAEGIVGTSEEDIVEKYLIYTNYEPMIANAPQDK